MLKRIVNFYLDIFKNLSKLGKIVLIIVLIKFFVFFAVLKPLFFKNYLKTNFKTEQKMGEHVINQLIKTK